MKGLIAFLLPCIAICVLLGLCQSGVSQSGKLKFDLHRKVTAAAFSPDGSLLAAVDRSDMQRHSYVIRVYSMNSGQQVGETDQPHPYSFAISPSKRFLAIGGINAVRIIDLTTWKPIAELKAEQVFAVKFSPDETYLASAGNDGMVRLWKTDSWRLDRSFDTNRRVVGLAFNASGNLLAAGCVAWSGIILKEDLPTEPQPIYVWDTHSGQLLLRTDGLPYGNRVVSFTPDGDTLAGGGSESGLKLWRINCFKNQSASQDCVKGIESSGSVSEVTFSKDGSTFAFLSGSTATVVDTMGSRPRIIAEEVAEPPVAARFQDDGRLVVITEGGKVLSWVPKDFFPQ